MTKKLILVVEQRQQIGCFGVCVSFSEVAFAVFMEEEITGPRNLSRFFFLWRFVFFLGAVGLQVGERTGSQAAGVGGAALLDTL